MPLTSLLYSIESTENSEELPILLPGNGGVVCKPITPPDNGNGLGVLQETIQNRDVGGRVAQRLVPFGQPRTAPTGVISTQPLRAVQPEKLITVGCGHGDGNNPGIGR
jgi:hypothetical protein